MTVMNLAIGIVVGFIFDQSWYPVTKLPMEAFIGDRTLCDVIEIVIVGLLVGWGVLKKERKLAMIGLGFGIGSFISTLKQWGRW